MRLQPAVLGNICAGGDARFSQEQLEVECWSFGMLWATLTTGLKLCPEALPKLCGSALVLDALHSYIGTEMTAPAWSAPGNPSTHTPYIGR